ncbi:hypothetical protein ACFS5L_30370 [Streptomyces phyllanthi]|uniref:NUDIX domain-containing protein n=1 Tax=Streptomyces phyllanthi TaxID=1803180 RepID=A0A5N8VZ74_9ACTN|nr:hypothetical protein [Streptomyces phyllanthi]MPY39348.1 hypothetical protein [Streptomyces phyllanthi]
MASLVDASPNSGHQRATVAREIQEETGWEAKAGPLINGGLWIYEPVPGHKVLIGICGCSVLTPERTPIVSSAHKQVGLVPERRSARVGHARRL